MLVARIEADLSWSEFVILRLLRRWAASRIAGENPLPALFRLARELGESPDAAIALDSAFQLTEACLGRPIETECCCSRASSPDERAILALIGHAPANGPVFGTAQIPHGLPGALCWAVASARMALRLPPAEVPEQRFSRCPFERP